MSKLILAAAVSMQILAAGGLIFGDIGFDRPGRYGLHFDHAIMLAGLYLLAFAIGLTVCIGQKRWLPLAAQVVLPLLLLAVWNAPRPQPRLDAAKYQQLVGRTKEEVSDELRQFDVKGYSSADGLNSEFFNGMEVFYSKAGRAS